MKVTKDMLHKDLQPHYNSLFFLSIMFKYKWSAKLTGKLFNVMYKGKDIEGLNCDEVFIPRSKEDHKIRARVYRPLEQEGKLPVMLYTHGGGLIFGNPEMCEKPIKKFIETRPCVVVAPDYRKAFTEPYPAGFNDCYDTLLWIKENAEELGIDPDKVIIAGHSAGGGLAAAVTLKARDTQDVKVAFQMPFYPMIDDRQPNDPAREILGPGWDTRLNRLGWNSYLANLHKEGKEIPAYASPARNTDYSGFPPTITFVGTLEPFYHETVRYVEGLKKANVDVAFKEYEGCVHSFEDFAETDIGNDALDFTFTSYAEFYDKYIAD
ncbi:MAG: alpha/beta hydrolase [Spirochaetales bacterium]|nr:alpha/beta hydrolase [Spirochaetales bacterium]